RRSGDWLRPAASNISRTAARAGRSYWGPAQNARILPFREPCARRRGILTRPGSNSTIVTDITTERSTMTHSRRDFLKTAAVTGTIAAVPAVPASAKQIAPQQIVARFAQLPGDVAFKIFAPSSKDKKAFV